MPAALRSTPLAVTRTGSSPTIPAPDDVQPGDVILIAHIHDAGDLAEMGISGGGSWATIGEIDATFGLFPDSFGGTKIYRRVAGASEPSTYTLSQDSGSEAAVVIMAVKDGTTTGLVIELGGDVGLFDPITSVPTPPATPSTAGSLEIRVAAALLMDGTASWGSVAGYTPVATVQADTVAARVATRGLVSSAPVGEVVFTAGAEFSFAHGFTILVPSGEGGSTPTPPVIPPFTPGVGVSLYRYTVHDLITGLYLSDIFPLDVSFDRRIGEPGTFSARLPIPNEDRAAEVRRIIPRRSSDLTTGPGRIAVYVWRGGAIWGCYWIHGARISRSRRGTISVELRGSTLDAYLLHATVSEDLSFVGDQIANARDLLSDLMADPYANIGLALMSGTSGVTRPLPVLAADDKTYGDALTNYAREYGGFEWTVDHSISGNTVTRDWLWGYPTISSETVHTFQESPHGGDIVEWGEEIDALRGGTRARVRGGTPEATDATAGSSPSYSDWATADDHLAAGWPRLDQVVDHPGQSTDTTQLDNYAARWVETFAGAVRVYSCTVVLGKSTSISPSSLGDQIRRLMVNVWYGREDGGAGFVEQQRLIGIGITPIARGVGKDEAQLILEEPNIA